MFECVALWLMISGKGVLLPLANQHNVLYSFLFSTHKFFHFGSVTVLMHKLNEGGTCRIMLFHMYKLRICCVRCVMLGP